MKKVFFVLLLFAFSIVFSQNRSVISYQKINDVNGGFLGNLDINDSFGVSIDNIGDLDGNGVNDLAVGAFGDDDGGNSRGAVWILFLDINDNVISYTKISDTSGGFMGVLDNDDRFGGAVSYLGDLNNDGLIEIAVGADYDADGGFWHGAVWILTLNTNGTVNSFSKISDTQGGFTGFINGDAIFATDIENIGDLNGDGISDLAVGSRRDNDGGGNEGAIWILFMNNDFTVNSYQKISETQGNLNINLDFEDYFGGSIANIGDLNGDGVTDLVVGSYRDDDQMANSGSFYVLFLNADGTVDDSQKVSNFSGNFNAIISSEALFGESIDGVVDIDSDGKIEIVVGAMKQINPTLVVPTGGFFIIELNPDGTVSEEYLYTYAENCFSGELENGDLFGGSVSFLSSNSNGVKVAVGAYGDSENGFRKGAAWILNLGEVNYNIKSSTSPTGCGSQDGTITISGLSSGLSYTIDYTKDSLEETVVLNSTPSGEIVLTGLGSGNYGNITVTEVISGCSDNLGQVILSSMGFMATVASTSPTRCGSQDGTITISGLSSGLSYTIDYTKDSLEETVVLNSTPSGEIVLTGLGSGNYGDITVTEVISGCSDNLGQVILSSMGFMATVASTSPTRCGSQDGTITISGLSSGLSYTIDYTKDSLEETVVLNSTPSGEIVLTGLGSGNYGNITVTEVISGCTIGDFGFIELTCFDDNSRCFRVKNFFTPNNDGFNDEWGLELLSESCNYTLYIFDRYGKLLKTLNPQNSKWDGTYKGLNMPSNDYWYLVNYNQGENNLQYTAHFTLKR